MTHFTRTIARSAVLVIAGLLLCTAAGSGSTQKFFKDDPIASVTDSQDASSTTGHEIDLVYDTLQNLLTWPGDQTPNVRALSINTIDEVPDSSWFTNRLGSRPMTVDEVLKGGDTTNGPASGEWTVVSAKNDGVTPGFTVRDSQGTMWFLKVDPPGYPAMATGTEIVVAKLMWALGYHVPEVHLATLQPAQLAIDAKTTITPKTGRKRSMKRSDINDLLRKAHRNADGSYRVIASKALAGQPLGGFKFYGSRSDDPNDVIAHEHRRELRGYGTFAAWLNHVDSKSINTLDTLVEEDGRKVVRHHLLDFGSTIGSAGVYPREPFEGPEYLIEGKKTLAGIPTFGFYIKDWRTAPLYRARSVGSFPTNNVTWNPEQWKPRYGNSAFRSARLDDKFWAAQRLQRVSTEMLQAVIGLGQFNDPPSEAALLKFLVDRRDTIVRRYLTALNPVANVHLSESGTLEFRNAAVDADVAMAPARYTVDWSRFDNSTHVATRIEATFSDGNRPIVTAPASLPSEDGAYIRAEIAASGGPESWSVPAHAYFVREARDWRLVGFERMPQGNAPNTEVSRTSAGSLPDGGRVARAQR